MKKDEENLPQPENHLRNPQRITDVHQSPYSNEQTNSILDAARQEYEKLAKKKAFEDRVSKGIGVDWRDLFHIE